MPTQVTYCFVSRKDGHGTPMMVGTRTSETFTASGSNQSTTATAPASGEFGDPVARISTTVDVYASTGVAPNSTTDTSRFMIPAGGIEYVAIPQGHKVAVSTA